eukprot:3634755-Pyramimonas_sp.AAC.1
MVKKRWGEASCIWMSPNGSSSASSAGATSTSLSSELSFSWPRAGTLLPSLPASSHAFNLVQPRTCNPSYPPASSYPLASFFLLQSPSILSSRLILPGRPPILPPHLLPHHLQPPPPWDGLCHQRWPRAGSTRQQVGQRGRDAVEQGSASVEQGSAS